MANLLDSLWKRESCAKWCGVVLGSIAGGYVLVRYGFPVYSELVLCHELFGTTTPFLLMAVSLVGPVAGFAWFSWYVVNKCATRLAAWLLLSDDAWARFLESHSWIL